MATFLPIRGTQSEIDATAIVDGQLLFTTDTNNIYIDNGTTRTLYRSVSTVQLSSQNTTADAIAFGKDSSGNYGYYEAGSSELKSFKKGNATVAQVLSPYTFSNASASGLTGTMANRGSLTFNPSSSTTQSLPMGYYSGGTLSTVNAYNAGFSDGYAAGQTSLSKIAVVYGTRAYAYSGWQPQVTGTAIFTKSNGVWTLTGGTGYVNSGSYTTGAPFQASAQAISVSLS